MTNRSTRARGANATMRLGFENAYGTVADAAAFATVPFVSSALGEERPLLDDDTLGHGREMQDPTYDVATDTGDIVVPLDARGLWYWLRLMLDAPASSTAAGVSTHVFTSGSVDVPSASIEIGHPEVPSYSVNLGSKVNQLKFDLKRSGLGTVTVSLIAKGETDPEAASVSPDAIALALMRFAQASGSILVDDEPIASITAATVTLSNNLEPIEVIEGDGRIAGADPGMFGAMGSLTALFDSNDLVEKARAGTPVKLVLAWTKGPYSLTIVIARAFLPVVKKSVSGPKGIQRDYNFTASGAQGASAVVTLKNDVAVYG